MVPPNIKTRNTDNSLPESIITLILKVDDFEAAERKLQSNFLEKYTQNDSPVYIQIRLMNILRQCISVKLVLS